jgi:hypothetical protein
VRDSLLKNNAYGQSIDVHISKIDYSKRKFVNQASLYLAAMSKVNLAVTLDIDAGVQTITKKADMIMEFLVDQGKNAQCKPALFTHFRLG